MTLCFLFAKKGGATEAPDESGNGSPETLAAHKAGYAITNGKIASPPGKSSASLNASDVAEATGQALGTSKQ